MPFLPKPYTKVPVTIYLEEKQLEKIDRLAAAENISRSVLIRQCIDYALANLHHSGKKVK